MKKILFLIISLLSISCNRNDNESNNKSQTNNTSSSLIKNVTFKDEYADGTLRSKSDYKFEYSQNNLIKLYGLDNNFFMNLTYSNTLLTKIDYNGTSPGYNNWNLFYDDQKNLIKVETPTDSSGSIHYKTFEYPDNNKIIVTNYVKKSNGIIYFDHQRKIYFENGNVAKIETIFSEGASATNIQIYEYDQKINPLIYFNKNIMLTLGYFPIDIYYLEDYTQLSKNNVVKILNYSRQISPEYLFSTHIFNYEYSNNLPTSKWFYSGEKDTIIYSY